MHGRQSCVRLPSFAFAQRLQLLAAQACMMLPSKSSKGSQRGHGAAGHGCRHCGAAEECHHAVPVCCSSAAVAHQVHSVALPMHTATGLAWPQCPSVIAGSHARARRDHAIHASTLNARSERVTSHLLRRRRAQPAVRCRAVRCCCSCGRTHGGGRALQRVEKRTKLVTSSASVVWHRHTDPARA